MVGTVVFLDLDLAVPFHKISGKDCSEEDSYILDAESILPDNLGCYRPGKMTWELSFEHYVDHILQKEKHGLKAGKTMTAELFEQRLFVIT